MTWDAARAIADEQITQWKATGVGPATALVALHDEQPAHWQLVREQMAAWVMLHGDEERED